MGRKRKIDSQFNYLPIDRYQYVNVGDDLLKPIRIDQLDVLQRTYRQYGLTPPDDFPPFDEVAGYGIEPSEQVFEREVIPDTIKRLERQLRNEIRKTKNTSTIKRELMLIDRFWETIEGNQEKYAEEIAWLKQMWRYRLLGKFFFCNGRVTYIVGHYWFFLNWWTMNTVTPEYRDRDRRCELAVKFSELDTTTFANVNEVTRLPEPNAEGEYDMSDVGRKICFGTNHPKHRRCGETSRAQAEHCEFITRTIEKHAAIQAKDDDTATKIFQEHFVHAFSKLPIFWKPMWDSSGGMHPKSNMLFDSDDPYFGLHNRVTYATSADAKKYDGDIIGRFHLDECFGRNTPILMYDGTIKKAQDIIEGDVVMGWDNTPRKVLDAHNGYSPLYEVTPSRGMSWICSEYHLITAKICYNYTKNYKKGRIVNMSVGDFYRMPKHKLRSYSLFRVGVDFPKQNHDIPPYLLGLWLGDGCHTTASIAVGDKEVGDYILQHAESNGLSVHTFQPKNGANCTIYSLGVLANKKITAYKNGVVVAVFNSIAEAGEKLGICPPNISSVMSGKCTHAKGYTFSHTEIQKVSFKKQLYANGLYANKHIPQNYLSDSYENRLELLAGLIDTDGHLGGRENTYTYEITQTRKKLAEQIQFLAQSLGFYASCNHKETSMKRQDGTYYHGEAYRVNIYGRELYKIPCRIPRKKILEQTYSNDSKGRNPSHTGFTIKEVGRGPYYGFEIEGDGMFLLSDFTVVHNSGKFSSVNINDVVGVVKFCMSTGGGFNINGKMRSTSTVDEIAGDEKVTKAAGENYLKLCMDSMYHERDENGQTRSGMYNIFFKASDGLQGFVDKYGNSIEDDPTPEQAKYIGNTIGAKRYIKNKVNEYKRKKDWEGLSMFRRQHPMSFKECFAPPSRTQFFNRELLESRLTYLTFDHREELPRRGNFVRETYPDGRVLWVDDDETGRFYISIALKPEETNLRENRNGVWFPKFQDKFVASADTFGLDRPLGRASNGGGAVRYRRDYFVDPEGKSLNNCISDRFVCTYNYRPETVEEYTEDMLMMSQYFGAMMYPERNKTNVIDHFRKRGYEGYLLYDIDRNTGHRRPEPGWWNGGEGNKMRLAAFNAFRDEVIKNCNRIFHPDLLQELLDIRDPKDMTNYDLFTAAAGCLLAERNPYYEYVKESKRSIDTSDWMPMRVL